MIAIASALALVAAGGLAFALLRGNGDEGQTADVNAQGAFAEPLYDDAARLVRRDDGLLAEIDIPTPSPGSYEYPTGDLTPPWAEPHPSISSGASDAPEVFTAWLFAFNDPEQCTDDACDLDDLGVDTAARGGSFQIDGRIADGERLVLLGRVLVGQEAVNGARLDNPVGAEVHLAIAPHGRTLAGPEGWRQLNGPVGNPDFWWGVSFSR